MKFSINKSELQNALSVVIKGVSTRSTLPVLSGVLLEATQDKLTLQTTDLELSIQYSLAALVEEPGRAVVPGKLFSDIVKNLPDAAIHIEADYENALVTCDSSSFSIKALSPDDFPGFPQVKAYQTISIPFTQFASMVKRVARSVSKDESRAILTGALVTVDEGRLKMVSTDSYRLALTDIALSEGAEEFQAVIAGSFLQDIASLPKTESEVEIALAENQILVSCDETVFINRRIEGNFPNYKQLISGKHGTRVKVDTERLISAVKRTSLLGSPSTPVKFDVNVASQTIQLSVASQDVGTAQETLTCEVEGEDVEIAFNYSYVLDGLSVVGTESVCLELGTGREPGIFKADEPESFLYLVMPVRIS